MFWSDEDDKNKGFSIPDDVVDLSFRITSPTLPLDHAHALSSGLLEKLPWLKEEKFAAIHLIHGAASGNGWFRPEDVQSELLHLSRRTRMRLRLPKQRLDDARELTGKTLDVAGHPLEVGKADVCLLSSLSTLFARYVVSSEDLDETQFLQEAARELKSIGVSSRKLLGGITHSLYFPETPIFTRSLMVAELEPEQSIRLQQTGLGEGRTFGCGIFLPHKGIKAVKQEDD
uniref:CRISPR-associated protein, Cas6-related n=1 Tax=uncultured bacterium ws138B4 TaxID=1131827 RepID=I1X4M8_9BACT|nr:CRISPR-associated protein, Cas6-related [uncultured bacterium ws138B4]